jgi:hypothetical protein
MDIDVGTPEKHRKAIESPIKTDNVKTPQTVYHMTLKYSILSIIETEIIRHELNEKHTVKTGCDDCFEAKKIFESQAAVHSVRWFDIGRSMYQSRNVFSSKIAKGRRSHIDG